MTKAKQLRGKVRISEYYNNPWPVPARMGGFTLQRGHFYGQSENGGYYWVTALEKCGMLVKFYICFPRPGMPLVWEKKYLSPADPLVEKVLKAVPRRREMGINSVEKMPIEQQLKHGWGRYNPRITTRPPFPYTPLYIPMAGRS